MTTECLAVLLSGDQVGWLERSDAHPDPSFTYTPEYVSQGTIALSARLPIQSGTFPPNRVAPYLLGLLPENIEVRERWARQLGVTPDDAFGMLATMGWDCPGAVQFCPPDETDELLKQSGEFIAIDPSAIGERIRALTNQESSWTMPEEHWSLGGQQEKFALARIGDQWLEAHGSAATTHIIKPGITRLKHQALVEHLTMQAAANLGIDVARTEYVEFDGAWALVVERFDRSTHSDGLIRRFHQEDFCQAVGRTPEHKYEDRRGPTLRDMVKVVARESTDQRNDRLALADFLIINFIAGAPDGHSKNIALLRLSGGSTVAPLFDLATGLAYDSDTVDRRIALSIGGERSASRIYGKQWDKAAATLGIDSDLMSSRVAQLATQFPDAFKQALQGSRNAPGVDQIGERLLPAVVEHCANVIQRI